MQLDSFIEKLKSAPESVAFTDTMAVIEANYTYTPTAFSNGEVNNDAGTNEGSCKLFAFAQLNQLSPEETLACFGDYYRVDVLQHPDGSDHGNIRNFMQSGWEGVQFDGKPLTAK